MTANYIQGRKLIKQHKAGAEQGMPAAVIPVFVSNGLEISEVNPDCIVLADPNNVLYSGNNEHYSHNNVMYSHNNEHYSRDNEHYSQNNVLYSHNNEHYSHNNVLYSHNKEHYSHNNALYCRCNSNYSIIYHM